MQTYKTSLPWIDKVTVFCALLSKSSAGLNPFMLPSLCLHNFIFLSANSPRP